MYALAARSLLTGRYALGILPGDPILTSMTPGWPFLLMPAAVVSGDSPVGYQVWSWGWLVLCDILFFRWLSRRFSPVAAAAGTALFALNPLVLSRSGVVMSEVPFLACLLGLLLILESKRGLKGWESGLGLGFTWLIRPGALPLFPAVLAYYLCKGKVRRAAQCAAVSAAVLLSWKFFVHFHGAQVAEMTELAMTLPGRSASGWFATALWNLSHALTLWGRTLLPWAAQANSTTALGVGFALAAVSAAGFLPKLRKKGFEAAAAYLAGGAILHAIWPWWFERYLLSFLPFLIWGGMVFCKRWMPEKRMAALLWFLALLPLPVQGRSLVFDNDDRSKPQLARTYAWIRERTTPNLLWTSAFYARDAFYTGRPFRPVPVETAGSAPEDFASQLRKSRISYVLWQEMPDLGSSLGEHFMWSRRLRDFEKALETSNLTAEFTNLSEGSVVYRVPGSLPY